MLENLSFEMRSQIQLRNTLIPGPPGILHVARWRICCLKFSTLIELMSRQISISHRAFPRLICLIGPDGTGKSTFTRHLIDKIDENGGTASRIWLRYPFFFSIPILVYCRLTGLSYYLENQGVRYGVWEMWRSRWVPFLFSWCQLVDTFLFILVKIYLPLWMGRNVICDRYVHDVLVDLMLGIGELKL